MWTWRGLADESSECWLGARTCILFVNMAVEAS